MATGESSSCMESVVLYQCDVCHMLFDNKDQLDTHRENEHQNDTEDITAGDTAGQSSKSVHSLSNKTVHILCTTASAQQQETDDSLDGYQNDDLDTSANSSDRNDDAIWVDEATGLLINLYRENKMLFDSKAYKRREIWESISRKMQEFGFVFSEMQCNNKWKSLRATYRKVAEHSSVLGQNRNWKFYNAIHELCGDELTKVVQGIDVNNLVSVKTKSKASKLVKLSPTNIAPKPAPEPTPRPAPRPAPSPAKRIMPDQGMLARIGVPIVPRPSSAETVKRDEKQSKKKTASGVKLPREPVPVQNWSRRMTLQLMTQVKAHEHFFLSPMEKKKRVWERVASAMRQKGFSCTMQQAENRWKTLRAAYRRAAEYRRMYGRDMRSFTYYRQMSDLYHITSGLPVISGREGGLHSVSYRQEVNQQQTEEEHANMEEDEVEDEVVEVTSVTKDLSRANNALMPSHWDNDSSAKLVQVMVTYLPLLLGDHVNRTSVWHGIATEMRNEGFVFTVAQCKNRWRNLREIYCRLLMGEVRAINDPGFYAQLKNLLDQYPQILPMAMIPSSIATSYRGQSTESRLISRSGDADDVIIVNSLQDETNLSSAAHVNMDTDNQSADKDDPGVEVVIDDITGTAILTPAERLHSEEDKEQSNRGISWNGKSTKALIGLYRANKSSFRFNYRKKKFVWFKIARGMQARGFPFNSEQCCNRWKALTAAYRKTVIAESSGEGANALCPFYEDLRELYHFNPSIVNGGTDDSGGPMEESLAISDDHSTESGYETPQFTERSHESGYETAQFTDRSHENEEARTLQQCIFYNNVSKPSSDDGNMTLAIHSVQSLKGTQFDDQKENISSRQENRSILMNRPNPCSSSPLLMSSSNSASVTRARVSKLDSILHRKSNSKSSAQESMPASSTASVNSRKEVLDVLSWMERFTLQQERRERERLDRLERMFTQTLSVMKSLIEALAQSTESAQAEI